MQHSLVSKIDDIPYPSSLCWRLHTQAVLCMCVPLGVVQSLRTSCFNSLRTANTHVYAFACTICNNIKTKHDYVTMCSYMYVHAYMNITHIYIYTYINITHIYIRTFNIHTYIHTQLHKYLCISISISIYIYMYVYILCIYV